MAVASLPSCYSYIRFSRQSQERGNSLQRQLEMSEEYAREHGLHIDDSLRMQDLGVSAFKGLNRAEGALGRFLDAIKGGHVPRGSVLLVESLDRLSREQVLDAFETFRGILKSGVKIVTLSDRMEYSEETLASNFGNLMISITIMSRAHEESLMKAKRSKAAWDAKIRRAPNEPMTAICPYWLTLDKQSGKWVQIPERVALVQRIFALASSGWGRERIAKQFNEEGILAWKSKRGWYGSYVLKITKNRSVLGELQPHKRINGKRVPVGDAIEQYYPAIIDSDLFYSVQSQLTDRASTAGRTGRVNNLFTGVIKCGYCGSSMALVDKGLQGNCYMLCDGARRGRGCYRTTIRYRDMEKSFLTFCKELHIAGLFRDEELHQRLEGEILRAKLVTAKGELAVMEGKRDNLLEALSDTDTEGVRAAIKKKLALLLEVIETKQASEVELEKSLHRTELVQKSAVRGLEELRETILRLDGRDTETVNARLKLRTQIRNLVDRLEVYSKGVDFGKNERECYPEFSRPSVVIIFKSGAWRILSKGSHKEDGFFRLSSASGGDWRETYKRLRGEKLPLQGAER